MLLHVNWALGARWCSKIVPHEFTCNIILDYECDKLHINFSILTAFENSIKIFSSNYDGSLVSFSKEVVSSALTGVKVRSATWKKGFVLAERMAVRPRAKRVYNFVARTRITSKLWFRFGHKSFYRFGICSCLATSHKQILKMPFNMTSSCTLGFQATRPATWAHFIHPLFVVLWRIAKYFSGK